jgi:hypothetical protein
LNAIVVDNARLNGKKAWHICLLLKQYGILTKPTHDNIIRLVCHHNLSNFSLRRCASLKNRLMNALGLLARHLIILPTGIWENVPLSRNVYTVSEFMVSEQFALKAL